MDRVLRDVWNETEERYDEIKHLAVYETSHGQRISHERCSLRSSMHLNSTTRIGSTAPSSQNTYWTSLQHLSLPTVRKLIQPCYWMCLHRPVQQQWQITLVSRTSTPPLRLHWVQRHKFIFFVTCMLLCPAGHSSQHNITQHGMLPQYPTGTAKLMWLFIV